MSRFGAGSRRGQSVQSPTRPPRSGRRVAGPTGQKPVSPPTRGCLHRPAGSGRPPCRATGRAGGRAVARWCGPGPCAVLPVGIRACGRVRPTARSLRQRSRPVRDPAGRRNRPGNPVRYQPVCFRNWRVPRSSPNRPHNRSRWTSIIEQISPRPGGGCFGSPRKAAARSRNSHGRPRQPRPTTTPSHPVDSIIASASVASHRSPLPRTGMVVTACLSRPMAFQSAVPE